jgi:hypothetical protein
MQDKLIQLCGLYENISKTSGKKYLVGNLSFSSKVLIFPNDNAREGEPGWTLFVTVREPKPPQGANFGPPGGTPKGTEGTLRTGTTTSATRGRIGGGYER